MLGYISFSTVNAREFVRNLPLLLLDCLLALLSLLIRPRVGADSP